MATISEEEKALQAEKSRAAQFSNCYGAVTARGRKARRRALRRYRRGTRARKRALRRASRRTARGRARCVRSFGRKPGRVTTLAAKAGSKGKIILTFRAPGSDGSSLPPARNYVIKQSFRPIRSRRQFRRALALCKGECSFPVTKRNASITLNVTGLHRRTRYYYSVAARDNVSKRLGARSKTVGAKTR